MKKFSIQKCLTYICFVLIFWACVWSITGDESLPPNGSIFILIIIFIAADLSGELISLLHLPPLLGMLIVGIVIGNTTNLKLDPTLSSTMRSLAGTVIFLRAGIGLDPKILRKLSGVSLRLGFIPCIVEATIIAFTAYLLLEFSLSWGFLLGFVIAAVTPAVVVPGMLSLRERRIGINKGIPTLIMTAASIDDGISISGFGVALGIVFNTGSTILTNMIKGPMEILIGLGYGIVIGVILWYIPKNCNHFNEEDSHDILSKCQRLILLLLSGIFVLFGSRIANLSATGTMGCVTLSFVAALKWRHNRYAEPIEDALKLMALYFQPFLFALIGIEVEISTIRADHIGYALIVLAIGLIFRILTAVLVVWGDHFNFYEKLFIGLSWIPKATVQAAVGPIAFDLARNKGDARAIELGTLVLTIAVISIIITAPLGAFIIEYSAPKLLTFNDKKFKDIYITENGNAQISDVQSQGS